MKNKLLPLIIAIVSVGKISSMQKFELQKHPDSFQMNSKSLTMKHSNDGNNEVEKKDMNLFFSNLKIKDCYELGEISSKNLSSGNISDAANYLIASAAYGNSDVQDSLYRIDKKSLQFTDSNDPLSKEAISYYDELKPKVENYLKLRLHK